MPVLAKSLESLMNDQCVVDLYRDHLSSESLTGVISGLSEEFVHLSLISDSGLSNGLAVCFVNDLTRVRWQGNERNSILLLSKAFGSVLVAPKLKLDSIGSVLRSVADAYGYVNVLTERMDSEVSFIGKVVQLDDEALLLDSFGTFSSRDRSSLLVRTNEITRVDADAPYERSVAYLSEQKAN